MEYLLGLVDLPWWGYIVVTLVLTHITIASVTIFLHRHQAHRALDLHPLVSHFFRFWLWLTTGMITKEWAAIHRKHHAKCETEEDPHSPRILGINKVLWDGIELYRQACLDKTITDKFGHGTPDDWIERNLYAKYNTVGIALMAVIDLLLFGVHGITIWAVQMIWIPLFAAGVINGIGHFWGYRNFENEDCSTNVFPLGILIGGEELHNNHHTFGTSAKLSYKWWEFDIGWMYIRILEICGLAKVRRVAPLVKVREAKPVVDFDTLQTVIANRYQIASQYAKHLKETVSAEIEQLRASAKLPQAADWNPAKQMRLWLKQEAKDIEPSDQIRLTMLLEQSKLLDTIYSMRLELSQLWERSSANKEQLLNQLQDWCKRAEASGIASLQDFSRQLRGYAMA